MTTTQPLTGDISVSDSALLDALHASRHALDQGHSRLGLEHAQVALRLLEPGTPDIQSHQTHRLLAQHLYQLGQLDHALEQAAMALHQATDAGLSSERQDALAMLSLLLLEQGLLEEGLEVALEARELAGQLGGQSRISWAHNRIAVCLGYAGRYAESLEHIQAAHRHAVQSEDKATVLSALNNGVAIRIEQAFDTLASEQFAEADAMAEAAWPWANEAESMLPALFDSYRHVVTQCNLGELRGLLGAPLEGMERLEQALDRALARGYRRAAVTLKHAQARMSLYQGEHDAAERYIGEALVQTRHSWSKDRARLLKLLVQLHRARHDAIAKAQVEAAMQQWEADRLQLRHRVQHWLHAGS